MPHIDLRQSLWGITPEALPALARFSRGKATEAEVRAEIEPPEPASELLAGPTQGRVAVIPLQGVITPTGSFLGALTGGGGGLQSFRESLAETVANDDISTILIAINSPGGRVDLVPETAAEVRAASQQKKVVAIATTLAASAAYWIGSQASEFVVTPSGQVGSIGVFCVHEDWSAFDERMGIKTTLISAGKHKVAGNMYEPLSEEARAVIEEGVYDVYEQFTAAVALGRGATVEAVKSGYGEGACVGAQRAVDLGLADSIETFEDTARRLVQEARGGRSAEQVDSPNLAGSDGEENTLLAQMRGQLEHATKSLKEGTHAG
jgi:signal peptide peptidase SppA